MMKTLMDNEVTPEDINEIKNKLVSLHLEVSEIRARMAPLREEMYRVRREYEKEMSQVHIRYMTLLNEIELRGHGNKNERKEDESGNQEKNLKEEKDVPFEDKSAGKVASKSHKALNIQLNREEVQKEQLLTFLPWVVDQESKEDERIMSKLVGMNEERSISLADMLELVPHNLLVLPAGRDEEDLPGWYDRLRTWHEALQRLLIIVKRDEMRVKNDTLYKLLQQYNQGTAAWKSFVNGEINKMKKQIQEMEIMLEKRTCNHPGRG